MCKVTGFKVTWLLALATALVACSRPAPPAEPIRAVKVVTVGLHGTSGTLEFAGEIRARVESQLGFRVGGKLLARAVEAGQHVKAGQVLARLDPQDLTLATNAARAQLAAARSSLDLATADLKRHTELGNQGFIGAAELERRDAVFKAAQAQFEQAQSHLAAQSNQADYAILRADAPGVVTAVLAERGQVVSAGAPVLQLAHDGPRDVVFAVPEDKVAAITTGTPAQVRVWSTDAMFKGVVREVAASADPVTRTFSVKVALRAEDDLALGSTVTVMPAALQHAGTPVIKLPTSALWQQGQASAVWLFEPASMTVKPQTVQIATADGNDVVISDGLQPGMQVVVAGVHVLAPGQKVMLYQASKLIDTASQAQTVPGASAHAR
ncbi:efflux RND transporter periplasmic adaptor subunit [Rhodoferax sp.]|uniref:efflux RND transporter periplasmic adaptor subunit n=1 Tax=Rhodoferax sp. TaxID=50421 RepID=UPI001A09B27C|nr:efflux RND transporter periplasmic adaptor subunit [Rhodoferax sp.]MBE0472686.1 efflux RND transporter periplasmic adaptor subunit [Rhodoferax sp.]